MSEVVGEGVIRIRTDESGVDYTSAGRRAGEGYSKGFSPSIKRLAVGIGAALSARVVIGGIKGIIAAGQESVKVGRLTAAVIKSTGGAANLSERQVGKLAGRLSYMAGVDDELIQSGLNVLLTFKKIRNEQGKNNDIFNQGAEAALNMSAALGTSLKGASIQVGKALNDPTKGVAALTRSGVSFTEAQKEQIKTLQESGDLLGAQRLILRELSGEFDGAAKSQATASDRMKVAFGNVEEALGKALLPTVQDFSRYLLREGVPVAEDFAKWFRDEAVPGIKDLKEEYGPLAHKLLPAAAEGFRTIRDYAKTGAGYVEDLVDAFNGMPDWAKKAVIGGAVAGFGAKKLGLIGGSGKGLFARGGSPLTPAYVSVVGGLGTGVPLGVDGGDGNRRRRGGRPRSRSNGRAALALLGIPIVADILTEDVLGWEEAGEREKARRDRFFERWGEDTAAAAQSAREALANQLDVDVAHNIGEFGPFRGIPGTDIFVTDDARERFADAVKSMSGDALISVNRDLQATFGVGLPRLVKEGMLDSSVLVELALARQRTAFIRETRTKVQELRAGIEGDYTARFTLLGINVANAQINGMFDLFMARNARLAGAFPASEGGTGSTNPPNQTPPERTITTDPSGRGPAVVIANANFHDWNDYDRQTSDLKRLAGIGGRRSGGRISP